MKIHIESRQMVTAEIDMDAMITLFPTMWKDFLADYEEDGPEARWDYLQDFIHEVGSEDFLGNSFVNVVSVDEELEVDAA